MVSREEAEELTRQAREGRAGLRQQRAATHQRVGEAQHATEEHMRHVADKLPNPEEIRERAQELSDRGDRYLRQAERERAVTQAEEGG